MQHLCHQISCADTPVSIFRHFYAEIAKSEVIQALLLPACCPHGYCLLPKHILDVKIHRTASLGKTELSCENTYGAACPSVHCLCSPQTQNLAWGAAVCKRQWESTSPQALPSQCCQVVISVQHNFHGAA